MKKFTFVLVSLFWLWGFSQDNELKYNIDYPIISGCETAEDKKECFKIKTWDFFKKNISDSFQQQLIRDSKKDTISINLRLFFDRTGKMQFNASTLYSTVKNSDSVLNTILEKFPKVQPMTDEFDNGVASHVTMFLGLKKDNLNSKIQYIKNYNPEVVPFGIVDKVPVFKGCEQEKENIELRKCMGNVLRNYIQKNFRAGLLANSINLNRGIHGIYMFFNITKTGEIEIKRVTAPHPILKREGIRLLEGLPNATSPAFLDGLPVKIGYALPLKFKIE